jgi:hypothetical protein
VNDMGGKRCCNQAECTGLECKKLKVILPAGWIGTVGQPGNYKLNRLRKRVFVVEK